MPITSVYPGRTYFSMTPPEMTASEFRGELQIRETAEYRVNAPQSIAKPWLFSATLVGGPPARPQ
jgi:hypothetical protein